MERLNQLIKKQYAKVPKECKIAVVSVIVFGLLAHNYMFTNKLPNYDDMGITGFGATFRPVSYTHLDVYKRQGLQTVTALGHL